MPFGSSNFDHLPSPEGFALGPTAGFAEVFDANRKRQQMVDSAFGMQVNIRDAYFQQLDKLNAITGQENKPNWNFALDAIGSGINREMGMPAHDITMPGIVAKQSQYLTDIDKIDLALNAAKAKDPSVKTFKELYNDEVAKRQALIADSASATGRSEQGAKSGNITVPAAIPEFLGGMVGSLDPQRDPLFFGTMFLPMGAARGLVQKMFFEALAGGSVTAAQELLFTNPRAAALGEPVPDLFTSVLTAAVTSAAIRGGLEGVPPALRGLRDALPAPVRDALGGAPKLGDYVPHLSDEELLTLVRRLPDNPDARAAEVALQNEILTKETTPLGTDRAGLAATDRAVNEAAAAFEEARPMNPDSVLFREGPTVEQQVRDIVRQQNPDLYVEVDKLKQQIEEAQQKLDTLNTAKEKIDLGQDFFANAQRSRIEAIKAEFLSQIEGINTAEKEFHGNRITLHRGVSKRLASVDEGKFYTPDKGLANNYAGPSGVVLSKEAKFKKVLEADTLADAYKKVGLSPPDRDIEVSEEFLAAAKEHGYDGITYEGVLGKEYIVLDNKVFDQAVEGTPTFEQLRQHAKRVTQTQLESEFSARAETKRILKKETAVAAKQFREATSQLRKLQERTTPLEAKAAQKLRPNEASPARAAQPDPVQEQKLAENFDPVQAADEVGAQAQAKFKETTKAAESKTPAEVINDKSLNTEFTDDKGFVNMKKAGDAVRAKVTAALSDGAKVLYWVEGKPREIVRVDGLGMKDKSGNPWGVAPLMMQKPGETTRIEIFPQPVVDIGGGRVVPHDLAIAGPDGLRPASKVVEEMADEDAMLTATTNCANTGGKAAP